MDFTYSKDATPFTQGLQATPGLAALLADTGALVAGTYQALITFSATAAASFTIQHRDAANLASVFTDCDYELSGQGSCVYPLLKRHFAANERLRVIMAVALAAGNAQAEIQLQPLTAA